MVIHELKQTASRFEANFHVRGTDLVWSNHYWFNRSEKNYYLIDTGTIISWALLSLLNKYLFSNLLKLPTPKQGFAPWKFNISANKIVLYAIATSGWSALRRYSGNLASKSTVKAVSCLSLSFKISWRLAIKASIKMQSDLRKVMSAISSMRKKNNSPRVL